MAGEFSFDIVSEFDEQELRNAVDQTKREIQNRYDFKGTNTEITLNEDDILVMAQDKMKLKAVQDVLFQKLVNRKLSPKILDIKDPEDAAGMMFKQTMKLVKVLNQEQCKKITKMIKDNFPKVKTSIQGETVRVSAKSKDDLQAVMGKLREGKEIDAPLQFTNYR